MSNKGASEYPLVPHLTKIAKKKTHAVNWNMPPQIFFTNWIVITAQK